MAAVLLTLRACSTSSSHSVTPWLRNVACFPLDTLGWSHEVKQRTADFVGATRKNNDDDDDDDDDHTDEYWYYYHECLCCYCWYYYYQY